jgi:L-aspartate oxidase
MAICDVLIIGSGVAGLSLAIKLSSRFPDRKIYLVTKGDELQSNTRYAQGGISVVCDTTNDSFEKHIKDTLKAGDGLCDKEIVEKVIGHARHTLSDLIENGVDLDRDANGDFILAKEGGHSSARVVHYKDMTGFQIATSLLVKARSLPGITFLPRHTVIDLITDRHVDGSPVEVKNCFGALVLNEKNKTIETFTSRVTVLATGGIGQVYRTSTNPRIATGDGIGIAHRAGAVIRDMEFVQFHPTALHTHEHDSPHFLITEALRGYGALLRNCYGERFMLKYDPQGELACRDIVARAIENEIKATGYPCVFIDCAHLPADALIRDFPKIYAHCREKSIDITRDLIPVIPAAHYLCGGIHVDGASRTSINNLYALGECSHTGLHGANRLASNSLLEAVAFSEFCFQHISKSIGSIAINPALKAEHAYCIESIDGAGLAVVREKVQNVMTKYAGISRTTKGLKYALGYLELAENRLDEFYPDIVSTELLELRNILIAAKLIVVQSLNRRINKGTFYNIDLDTNYAFDPNKQGIHF